MKLLGSSFILVFCAAIPLAASGPGTTGGDILQIPVGAWAIAMGEAYTAQADDVSSLYWNPAGLAILNQSQASFMYNQEFQDMSYSHLGVATPLENGGIGASLAYQSFGTISGFDINNQPTGNISAYSDVATVGGAWLGDFWSAGFNAKAIQANLADTKATGFASDLGLNLIYPQEVFNGTLRFAATLRNLGTGMRFIEQTDPFSTEFRFGVAAVQMMDQKLNLSMDYGKSRDNEGSVYLGGEYWVLPFIALRAGYAGNHAEGNGMRAGMGFKFGNLSLDYAFSSYGDLGMDNLFELTYRFGVIRPLLTPEERKLLRKGKEALRLHHYSEAVLLFESLIELEPRYKPVRRLVKLAMKGYEKQEQYAKNLNTFRYSLKDLAPKDSYPNEAAELQQLLDIDENETAQANVMKPSKPISSEAIR